METVKGARAEPMPQPAQTRGAASELDRAAGLKTAEGQPRGPWAALDAQRVPYAPSHVAKRPAETSVARTGCTSPGAVLRALFSRIVRESTEARSPIKVPRYNFATWITAPEIETKAAQYLDTETPPIPEESPTSPALRGKAPALKDALAAYVGRRLGIDIQARFPDDDHFHFFDAAGYQVIRERFGMSSDSVAVHSTSGHLLVQAEDTTANVLGSANHELLHVAGFRLIGIVQSGDNARVERHVAGYLDERNDDFLFFNEAMTELTNMDVIRTTWSGTPALAAHADAYTNIGYAPAMIFLNALIRDLATKSGHSADEVLATLQVQYFGGGTEGLELLRAVYGAAGIDVIRTLPGDQHGLRRCAESLNLVL